MRTTRIITVIAASAAALLLASCGGGEVRDEGGEIVTGGDTDIFTLKVGDCLSETAEGQVSEVPTVPCSDPHDSEVYGEYTFTEADFPGDDAVATTADEACLALWDDFVGVPYEESTLAFSWYVPTSSSWDSGDRLVSCLIIDPTQTVTGTLKGANR